MIPAAEYKKVLQVLKDKRIVVTVEEHSCVGGLWSVIAEIIAENNITTHSHRLCLPEFIDCVGSQKELREFYDIDAGGIEKYVSKQIQLQLNLIVARK